MRKLILTAGLALALATPAAVTFSIPTAAVAQTKNACEKNRSNTRVAGTVGGGILGALAGRAIAGRGDNTEGMIIGGVAGAVAGNQLLKKKGPCPSGYTAVYQPVRSNTAARAAAPRCTWQNQAYRDAYGQTVNRQVEVCR
jgi:uncharacterized protein YcfJ